MNKNQITRDVEAAHTWGMYLRLSLSAMLMGLTSQSAGAQQAAVATGTVAGHVTADDTQRPARFAEVILLAKQTAEEVEAEEEEQLAHTPSGHKDAKTTMAMLDGRSTLNGSYSFDNVPVGDYYVFAKLGGYVLPVHAVEGEKEANDLSKVLADVPVVHVAANRTVTADLVLVRGAAISGTVSYDDGSPAVGLMVSLVPVNGVDPRYAGSFFSLQLATGSSTVFFTNDRGAFRIVGMRPGKYRVKVDMTVSGDMRLTQSGGRSLPSASDQQRLTLYAPGTFHQKDAQTIEIKGGEEIPDLDIKIALDVTHSVSGRFLSREDHHAPNEGYATLTDAADKDFLRSVKADGNGFFRLEYVPDGTYILATQAVDSEPDPAQQNQRGIRIVRTYKRAETNVIVSGHDTKLGDISMNPLKKGDNDTDADPLR